jgi:hypothetical protein
MFLETLKSVPSEAWIGLAGVVFGSLLTTFGVWLTNRSNLSQLQKQLQHEDKRINGRVSKERFEELYILVSSWLNGFFVDYLHLISVMRDQITYKEYTDIVIKAGSVTDFSRIEMIVGIYGGDITEAFNRVLALRAPRNAIITEHKFTYERGGSGTQFIEPFTAAQTALEDACEELKLAIARAARVS